MVKRKLMMERQKKRVYAIKLLTFRDFLRPLFSGLSSSYTIEPFIPPNIRAIEVDIMYPGMEDKTISSFKYICIMHKFIIFLDKYKKRYIQVLQINGVRSISMCIYDVITLIDQLCRF